MTSTMTSTKQINRVLQDLQAVNEHIEIMTRRLRQLEGTRDTLVAELLDLEGADDRRPVGVR